MDEMCGHPLSAIVMSRAGTHYCIECKIEAEERMSERSPLGAEGELVRALNKLFDEIPPPETLEEIDAVLRDAGFNPQEVAARMEALKTAITEAIATLEHALAIGGR